MFLDFLFPVIDAIVVSMDAIVNAARYVGIDVDEVTGIIMVHAELL